MGGYEPQRSLRIFVGWVCPYGDDIRDRLRASIRRCVRFVLALPKMFAYPYPITLPCAGRM